MTKLLRYLEKIERKEVQLDLISQFKDNENLLKLLEFVLDMRYIKSIKGFSYKPPTRRSTRWQDESEFIEHILTYLKETESYKNKVKAARNWLQKCERKEAAFYYRFLTRGIKLKITAHEMNNLLGYKRYLNLQFMTPAKLTLEDIKEDFPLIGMPQYSRNFFQILIDETGKAYIYTYNQQKISLCKFNQELTRFFKTIQRKNLVMYAEIPPESGCTLRIFDIASFDEQETNLIRSVRTKNTIEFIKDYWDLQFLEAVEPIYFSSLKELNCYIKKHGDVSYMRLFSPKEKHCFCKPEGYFLIDVREEKRWKRIKPC